MTRSVVWYVRCGKWLREGRMTRRFTDFPTDFYDLA